MSNRAKLRTKQRQAFRAYIKGVKGVEETWTGWRRELVIRLKEMRENVRDCSKSDIAAEGDETGNFVHSE